MHVVPHQAVSPDLHAVSLAGFAQEGKVRRTIRVTEENIETSITPLNHVMGHSWDHDACETSHPPLLRLVNRNKNAGESVTLLRAKLCQPDGRT
jgi:hypothetical protein